MAIQPGQPAPQFTLVSSDKQEVSLSDFKGNKVGLHFFPFAFTGVCTAQLCTTRDKCGYYPPQDSNYSIMRVSRKVNA